MFIFTIISIRLSLLLLTYKLIVTRNLKRLFTSHVMLFSVRALTQT